MVFTAAGSVSPRHKDAGVHRLDVSAPAKRHGQIQLLVDDLQRFCHALFTHGAQAVEECAAYVGAFGAQGDGLERVLAGAYAAVHVHLDLVADRRDDLGQA